MRSNYAASFVMLVSSLSACSPARTTETIGEKTAPSAVVVSVVGTNDLHGHILATPLLGGYVGNLRATRAKDGGVLLVDAGDMFQGTLESNLGEGAGVVRAYAALGYHAAAIGNHEFDFGPEGEAVTATDGADPRGALLARAKEAPFPFLSSNILSSVSGRAIQWEGIRPSVMVEIGGVSLGIVGVTSRDTLETTLRANVADLRIAPLESSVATEARALRARGAAAIVVLSHAGGKCQRYLGEPGADACEMDSEVFKLARALPQGTVDVIVAGHTHQGVAHEVNGTAIIESLSYGRAFGRVDLTFRDGKVTDRKIFAPQLLCSDPKGSPEAACATEPYEGKPVVRDEKVAAAIAGDLARSKDKRSESLGVVLAESVRREYDTESPLGNLFADLTRRSIPGADVGLMNGGGLRADLPAGKLEFGALFEAFPFDNRLAVATLRGDEVLALIRANLERKGGILSVSGVRVTARCAGDRLEVSLSRDDGRPVRADETLKIVASDFMMTGGDDFWGSVTPPKVETSTVLMRDAFAEGLRRLSSIEPRSIFDAAHPRLSLPGKRPLRCAREVP